MDDAATTTATDADAADVTAEESASSPVSLSDDPTSADASDTDTSDVTTAAADAGVSKACHSTLVKDYGARSDIVGQSYSATTGVTHTFTYVSGADSSLGVGVSASGTYGSFKVDGTSSKSSSASESFPTYGNNKGVYYKTGFHYGKYKILCGSRAGIYTYYKVKAISFAGGATTSSASIPTAKLCVTQNADTTFVENTSTAITWTDGLEISDYIGIDLSTETGYTKSAELTYHFNKKRRLCGTGDYPGGTPHRIVARSMS
ncbi:hypothetical protein ACFXJ5_38845 [Streptomyces sp. NPDC059373]